MWSAKPLPAQEGFHVEAIGKLRAVMYVESGVSSE